MFGLAVFTALPFSLFAQNESKQFSGRNMIFLEIGGNAGQYAFNYGRLFYQKESFKLTVNVGFSLWMDPIENSTVWNPALPLELSALLGKSKHNFEFGVGLTPYLEADITSSFESGELVQTKGPRNLASILPFRIGYRYQKPEGGLLFRVGYTPFFKFSNSSDEKIEFQALQVGLGVGWSF
ncbi:hypothetical protein [Algoriphagus chordae]|uniref:hypothetical protein n=1 Tax=Algoriphagus chordae TaxID=237019 RepID=UPI0011B7032E|nr:hypothetical protein [Algoriphagus chordae]